MAPEGGRTQGLPGWSDSLIYKERSVSGGIREKEGRKGVKAVVAEAKRARKILRIGSGVRSVTANES